MLVYVGQHIVGVWLSRVHVGDVTASTWLLEHVVQRGIAPPGAYLVYALGMLAAVDLHRVRAPCATVVRDAVSRRLCAALAALALCAMAACSGDDGGSASSSVAPSTIDRGRHEHDHLDLPVADARPPCSTCPRPTSPLADRRPSRAAAAGESPAAEVAPPSSVAPGSTSSVPLAPEFVNPATGGEPPNAVVPPASPDLKIRYIVLPHPDDEFEAWSMVAGDTTHYIVFILLTRGEYSRYCDGSGISELQANRAERFPEPQPFTGQGTPDCAQQRIDAWSSFLDGRGAVESALGRPGFLGQFDLDVPPRRRGAEQGHARRAAACRQRRICCGWVTSRRGSRSTSATPT